MAKPVFQVREARIIKCKDHWPHYLAIKGEEWGEKTVMLCVSHGDCESRGIRDGHEIRTSLIENVSEDGKTVETLNSIYQIND